MFCVCAIHLGEYFFIFFEKEIMKGEKREGMDKRNRTLVGRVVVSMDQRPVTLPSIVSKISLSCCTF